MPYLSILRCATDELYVGMTEDLQSRMARHNEGTACQFTSTRRPVHLVSSETADSIRSANARERQIKRWTRSKKEALIQGNLTSLRALAVTNA